MSKILHLNVHSCRISQSTVSRIIESDNFILRKKRKVHKLTLSTAEKRHKCALRLYRQLSLQKFRYIRRIVVLSRWKRNVCYIKRTDPDYERMILQQDSKGLMVFHLVGKHLCVSLNLVLKSMLIIT